MRVRAYSMRPYRMSCVFIHHRRWKKHMTADALIATLTACPATSLSAKSAASPSKGSATCSASASIFSSTLSEPPSRGGCSTSWLDDGVEMRERLLCRLRMARPRTSSDERSSATSGVSAGMVARKVCNDRGQRDKFLCCRDKVSHTLTHYGGLHRGLIA